MAVHTLQCVVSSGIGLTVECVGPGKEPINLAATLWPFLNALRDIDQLNALRDVDQNVAQLGVERNDLTRNGLRNSVYLQPHKLPHVEQRRDPRYS